MPEAWLSRGFHGSGPQLRSPTKFRCLRSPEDYSRGSPLGSYRKSGCRGKTDTCGQVSPALLFCFKNLVPPESQRRRQRPRLPRAPMPCNAPNPFHFEDPKPSEFISAGRIIDSFRSRIRKRRSRSSFPEPGQRVGCPAAPLIHCDGPSPRPLFSPPGTRCPLGDTSASNRLYKNWAAASSATKRRSCLGFPRYLFHGITMRDFETTATPNVFPCQHGGYALFSITMNATF